MSSNSTRGPAGDLAAPDLAGRLAATNLPIVSEANAPAQVAELFTAFRSRSGRAVVPPILQCFATHPPLLAQMIALAETMLFTNGALGRQVKELIATFVSSANSCAYCADSHGAALRAHGGSAVMVQAALHLEGESPALSTAQQALLTFASKVNSNSSAVDAADIGVLRTHDWTDLQIAETIHLVALFACFNRVVNGFGLLSQNLLALQEEPTASHTLLSSNQSQGTY